jgi:NADPH:quinone reductase-like Zn-dependent oxidoreductase
MSILLSPTDVGHVDIVGPAHSIVGCDFSGIIEEVGDSAIGDWKIGDRIAGVIHGGLFVDKGAFAQYLKVQSDLAWKPPPGITDQQAATYGISAVTAMQGLYTKLDVPWPSLPLNSASKSDVVILVYAASTGASLFAVLLAKLAGYTLVATCSLRNLTWSKVMARTLFLTITHLQH